MSSDAQMVGVRLFEFDTTGAIVSITTAKQGVFQEDDSWNLLDVQRREYAIRGEAAGKSDDASTRLPRIKLNNLESYRWPTEINAEMVSVALLKPDRMGTIDLFQYIRHLHANGQVAQLYEIQFWKKVFYPLSCMVMLVLALPFAYLHFRSGGITAYVFGGVLIGISFFVLNNIFDYFGNLLTWSPLLTAAAPSLVYSLLSLGAFSLLIFRR
jgi:lipopolysaccharide export system permease protein